MYNEKKFYTAKYDRVFKTIFCDEDNTKLMREFLSRILKVKIDELVYLRNELPLNDVYERNKTVDVLVKVAGKYIHIEMNSSNPNYLHNRNFIYFTNIFSKKTRVGEEYDLNTEFIHIDFTYGLSTKIKDEEKYYIMSTSGEKYIDNFMIIEYI